MQILLAFLMSEMDWSTILPQMVSTLRAGAWKVVMKCKNNTFFNFWAFFRNMFFFEAVTFFSPLVHIQSTQIFSTSKVMILMRYFLLSNRCYDSWISDIFVVTSKPLLGKQIFLSESYSLSIQNTVFLKN